ncbi:hypothetical protein [Porticoccus hydrocarbonoclasticus]|uniref:hypothetical protein n=1 Tax=Porticoccus hydrocarbonoclasticus TaxID=1073414 RepID=UPI000564623B|nr:hypothetical protein [Porticoccus hydrocarbonoclasticus]
MKSLFELFEYIESFKEQSECSYRNQITAEPIIQRLAICGVIPNTYIHHAWPGDHLLLDITLEPIVEDWLFFELMKLLLKPTSAGPEARGSLPGKSGESVRKSPSNLPEQPGTKPGNNPKKPGKREVSS